MNDKNFQPMQLSNIIDSTSIAQHPAIKALYQEALIAEQKIKVEKAEGLPEFTFGYTNQSLIGTYDINGQNVYYDASKRFSFINIGIAIPLTFGATKARMKSLAYEKKAAEANAMQQQRELTVQLNNALRIYQQYVAQYHYYQEQALINVAEVIAVAELGFKTGNIDYSEYLHALELATETQLNYLKSIEQINQSIIQIYSLTNQ